MALTAIQPAQPRTLDLATLDASTVMLAYKAKQSMFDTAAFDPEGNFLRLFSGGFSVWSGFPGAGKTTLIRQTICHLLKGRKQVFVASLEEDPRDVLVRLAATAAGMQDIDTNILSWFLDFYAPHLAIWSFSARPTCKAIIEEIRAQAANGCRHAFIDSLMCLDVANDDTEAQRNAANLIASTGRATHCHMHLVAHPRKLVSTKQEPDLNDVAGAREIGGLADNVLFVRRADDSLNYSPNSGVTPMMISVRKQRHFDGRIGDITGWFHREMRQFHVDQFAQQPKRYLPESAYAEDGSIK